MYRYEIEAMSKQDDRVRVNLTLSVEEFEKLKELSEARGYSPTRTATDIVREALSGKAEEAAVVNVVKQLMSLLKRESNNADG